MRILRGSFSSVLLTIFESHCIYSRIITLHSSFFPIKSTDKFDKQFPVILSLIQSRYLFVSSFACSIFPSIKNIGIYFKQRLLTRSLSFVFEVIVIFPIYGQFEAIRKPDSRRIVCKNYVFISSNLLFYKN